LEDLDDLDALIGAVETEFRAVHGPECVPFTIGDLEKNESACWPRIEWLEAGGEIGPQRQVAGMDPEHGESDDDDARPKPGSIATLKPQLEVDCWGETRAKARELVNHLILAAYRTNKFGIVFNRYEHITERHSNGGVKFKLFGEFELSVPDETEHTVGYITLRRHEWDVSSQGETVHGENEVPDP
jgi:hypothetical protein